MRNKVLTHRAMGCGRGCTHSAYGGAKKIVQGKRLWNGGKEQGGAERSAARRAEAEDEHPRRTEQDSAFVTDSETTGRRYMSLGIGLEGVPEGFSA